MNIRENKMEKKKRSTKAGTAATKRWDKALNTAVKMSAQVRRMLAERQKTWLATQKQEAVLAEAMVASNDERKKHDAICAHITKKLGIEGDVKRLKAIDEMHRKRVLKAISKSLTLKIS